MIYKAGMYATVVAVAVCVAGCAPTIAVFDSDKALAKGVPIIVGQPYVKQATHNKASEGGPCANADFVEPASLPGNERYYLSVTPAQLGKTSFVVKYGDNGVTSEVSVNTEPAGADTIKAVGEVAGTVLPFLAATKVPKGAAGMIEATEAPVKPDRACDAGEINVKFFPLAEWIKAQGAGK